MPMNPNEQPGEKLNAALHEWVVDAPLPPRFQEQVWNRIARPEKPGRQTVWQSVAAAIESCFNRPILAASYVALLLAAGVTTGLWHARDRMAEDQSQWRERYVQLIDPYKMPR